MQSILTLFSSHRVLYQVVFFVLYVMLKRCVLVVWRTIVSPKARSLAKYRELEDKIYMEQFEDPCQEFRIQDLESYQTLVKNFQQ